MVDCHYCDQEALRECARCGALYCDEHGEALCVRCEDPALALPSYRVYRGSLLALLVGTVLAVWLLLTPASSTDADGPAAAAVSGLLEAPTAVASAAPAATATTVAAGPTPSVTPTPVATTTATAVATEAPSLGTIEYTVEPGDTLFSIAELLAPAGADLQAFVDQIVAENGILDVQTISVGEVLRIPQ